MLPAVGIVIGRFLPAVLTPPTIGVENPMLEPLIHANLCFTCIIISESSIQSSTFSVI